MKKYVITLIALGLITVIGIRETPSTRAQSTAADLTGWAWSSNIGWISFNSINSSGASCASYCVQINTSTGAMTGYAWSSNIGWIKFGGLSNIPNSGTNAAVNLTTGAVTGFVRACGGTMSGNCSSMTSRDDGWDGWISLSGTATNGSAYGVTMNPATGAFSSFAWGSDVVGWLNFAATLSSTVTCPTCITGGVAATCSASTVTTGGVVTSVTFTVNAAGGTTPYTYLWTPDGQTGTSVTHSTPGSYSDSVTVTDSDSPTRNTFTAYCPATVVGTPAPIDAFQLYIGPNANVAGPHTSEENPLRISPSDSFSLVRTVNLQPEGAYDVCTPYAGSGSWSWTGQTITNPEQNVIYIISGNETKEGINTNGLYQFSIRCESSDPGTYPPSKYHATTTSAWFKITSVSEGER